MFFVNSIFGVKNTINAMSMLKKIHERK